MQTRRQLFSLLQQGDALFVFAHFLRFVAAQIIKPGAAVGVGMGQVNRVDAAGLAVARAGDREAIWEAFKPGSEPSAEAGPVLDSGFVAPGIVVPAGETEGLY